MEYLNQTKIGIKQDQSWPEPEVHGMVIVNALLI